MCRCDRYRIGICKTCKYFESINFIYFKNKQCYIRNNDMDFLERINKKDNIITQSIINKKHIIKDLKVFENNLDKIVPDYEKKCKTYDQLCKKEENLCKNIDEKIDKVEKSIETIYQSNLKKRKLEQSIIESSAKKRKLNI